MANGASSLDLAQSAANYATSGAISGGPWSAIMATATAVLSLTSANWTGTTTSVAVPAGTIIYGNFTAISVTSGAVIAYKLLQ